MYARRGKAVDKAGENQSLSRSSGLRSLARSHSARACPADPPRRAESSSRSPIEGESKRERRREIREGREKGEKFNPAKVSLTITQ